MAFDLPPEIILYDTEYTAWDGSQERKWSGPNEHREIVEIGAITVETTALKEVSSLDLYIRPRINPALSDYFIALTKISQKTVDDQGVDFVAAWEAFNVWRGDRHAYAYGSDETVIKENCELCGISYKYDGQFHNIRELFDAHGVISANYNSSTIPRAFGSVPEGSAHNGLSDARSILKGLTLLQEDVMR